MKTEAGKPVNCPIALVKNNTSFGLTRLGRCRPNRKKVRIQNGVRDLGVRARRPCHVAQWHFWAYLKWTSPFEALTDSGFIVNTLV
jgi:hypothetical protein